MQMAYLLVFYQQQPFPGRIVFKRPSKGMA